MTPDTLGEARERLRPYVEAAREFSGWDHDIETALAGPAYPWDYVARARELVRDVPTVLDLGTGGAECFLEILEGYAGYAVATESWHVNAPVANSRLMLVGARLIWCDSNRLPLADSAFDLILNRQEDFAPSEVARILKPGGSLLTQQVWGDWSGLARFFPRRTDFGDHYVTFQHELSAAGLDIVDARTHETQVVYSSLGDFVYLLCTVPWEIPDFDPLGDDLPALLEMEREVTTDQGFVVPEAKYILEAVKSA